MKRFIVLIIATAIFILATAQGSQPEYISGYPVHLTQTIYRIGVRFELGDEGCGEIKYWWVDEWGRPVSIYGEWAIDPKEPLTPEDVIQQRIESFMPVEPEVNPAINTETKDITL